MKQRATLESDPVDRLIDKLARPIFVYRMARGMVLTSEPGSAKSRGALRRYRKAKAEIEALVLAVDAADKQRMSDDLVGLTIREPDWETPPARERPAVSDLLNSVHKDEGLN